MFPGLPAVDNKGRLHQDLDASHDAQAPTLKPKSDEIAAISNLSAATTVLSDQDIIC